ncbi:MAG TPA: MBOAT family O-acyltransferase [Vicinamibacterales bacterium]|jgi:alginate O-acetyltransferase complex protein AlgI
MRGLVVSFTSPTFLFLFLPVVLAVYWVCRWRRPRDLFLLVASLIFYAWGEGPVVGLLLGSIVANYALGLMLEQPRLGRWRVWAIAAAVMINLTPLLLMKYAGFVLVNANRMLAFVGGTPFIVPNWHVPAGISFFTFMALTYVLAIHRQEIAAQRDPLKLGLFIALFPTIMAGPILRYHDLAHQLADRVLTRESGAEGARRFVYGLAKKALIADTLAGPANMVFSLGLQDLSTGVAWLGLGCFTLQIFFDFSGYSDMAIGLGRMLGFRFAENFDHPYTALSLRAFWTRWHISLSSWFRDYVFLRVAYPVGRALEGWGSTRLQDQGAYVAATLVTMLLIGLWHGASWTFVAWGLYNGLVLAVERTRVGKRIGRLPRPVQHIYTMFVVMIGWTIFRASSARQAARYLAALVGLGGSSALPVTTYGGFDVVLALLAGVLLSTRFGGLTGTWLRVRVQRAGTIGSAFLTLGEIVVVMGLLIASLSWLSAGTFTPFIYFRF